MFLSCSSTAKSNHHAVDVLRWESTAAALDEALVESGGVGD
jgi:hypothetical protein